MFFETLNNHFIDYKKTMFNNYYIDNIIDQAIKIDIIND